MDISVSILSSDNRIECINKLNKLDIEYFHMDVMDGEFVSNYQLPLNELNDLFNYTKKKLDIHLMVNDPYKYIDNINNSNISYITIHYEIDMDIEKVIERIKNRGYRVGLSIKPNTPIDVLIPYLDKIDLILLMSVEPGFGGQKFIWNTYEKISDLKKIINDKKLNIKIEVDGGVNDENVLNLYNYGVDIIVVGSFIVNHDNYKNQIDKLKI